MTYQPGTMGVAEGTALIYIALTTRVFLSTLSNIVGETGQIGWLAVFLSGIVGFAAFFVILPLTRYAPGDFFTICRKLLGPTATFIIGIYYFLGFLANSAILLRQYAENTLITSMPELEFQFAIGWFAASAALLCYLGIEAIARASYISLPFLVGGITLVIFLLVPFYIPYNLLPWQGMGVEPAVKMGFQSAGLNSFLMLLLILKPCFKDFETVKIAAISGALSGIGVKITYFLFFVMIFGISVSAEKTMPFFDMTRLVYVNRYIQHIESLFILLWAVNAILSISVSCYIAVYIIVRLFDMPSLKPLVPLFAIIIAEIALLPKDIDLVIDLDRYVVIYMSAGVYTVPLLLWGSFLLKGGNSSSGQKSR